MTKSELKTMIRGILKEELLREADEATFNYTFYYAGTVLDEEKFKQKLILVIKSLKSISNTASIPEAAEIIVSGLKEGSEFRGLSVFELGGKSFMVKAKKGSASDSAEATTETAPEAE
jgi:hypothetical protein